MPTRMPAQSPTLTDENIGRLKSNSEPITSYEFQVPAEEYNQFRLEFVAACDAIRSLAAAGATGTLQNVYNNGVVSPSKIIVDAMRGAVAIQDSNPASGADVFQIRNAAGGVVSRFGTNAASIRAMPAATNLGFVIDTDPYITMTGYLVPSGADLSWALGVAGKRFGAIAAGAISGYAKVQAYNANLSFDALTATVFDVTLTGNVSTLAFTNVSEGQVIHVILRQDATGGRQYVGGSIPAVKLRNGEATLQFSSPAGAVDVFTFVGNTSGGVLGPNVIEIARRQEDPIESRSVTYDMATVGASTTVYPHLDMSYSMLWVNTGDVANITMDFRGGGYARNGDEAKIMFEGMSTGAHSLSFTNNGAAFLAYTAGKTLTGFIQLVFFNGTWKAFTNSLTVV
jgi:hypothetical protein